MVTRVGLVDGLTPAVAAWLRDLNPASRRALVQAGTLIRRTAVGNVRAEFRRTGKNRTGTGMRGLKVRAGTAASVPTVRIWHGSGILAAHELGSTIPPATIRRRGALGRPYARRGFTLRRRPTLLPAYTANASAVLQLLEAEYQKVLATVPPPLRPT